MSSNPMFNNRVFEEAIASDEPMTLQGVVNKTLVLLLLTVASGYYTWDLLVKGFADKAHILAIAGIIFGIVLCFLTSFRPNSAKITAPAYAICEGLVLGSISYMYEALYGGIVLNAVAITITTLFVMLFLYKAKIIVATEKFRKVILLATISIALFYLIEIIASFFGYNMTIFNNGPTGIAISMGICIVAALNFIIDFDNIERATSALAPKYFEWYFGFSVLVTLIWLYIEVLRLLAKFYKRD